MIFEEALGNRFCHVDKMVAAASFIHSVFTLACPGSVYLLLTAVDVPIRINTGSSSSISVFIVPGMRKQKTNTEFNQNSNEKTVRVY